MGISAAACAAPVSSPDVVTSQAPAAPAPAPAEPGGDFGTSAPTPGSAPACAVLAAPAPVDVIVTVDQSGSMVEEAASVKANLARIGAVLDATGIDWRVVVIGTSSVDGDARFRTVAHAIDSNDTLEVILRTLGAWRDFLRPEALKVFVPITDDDSYRTALDFDRTLLETASDQFGSTSARRYVFMPITGAAAYPAETTCGASVENQGTQYLTLAKLTHGRWASICATDFAPVFDAIGAAAAKAASVPAGCDPIVR